MSNTNDNWLMLSQSDSANNKFKFLHHSTSSVVQLILNGEDKESEQSIYMDYAEFKELADFLHELTTFKL